MPSLATVLTRTEKENEDEIDWEFKIVGWANSKGVLF